MTDAAAPDDIAEAAVGATDGVPATAAVAAAGAGVVVTAAGTSKWLLDGAVAAGEAVGLCGAAAADAVLPDCSLCDAVATRGNDCVIGAGDTVGLDVAGVVDVADGADTAGDADGFIGVDASGALGTG
ncbi:TPA: hypothetical protein QDC51_003585 [Burkholderia multivorans]|nr:hypothetical protein [Burkholderia multivorans]MBU9398072.1 hypothetical protein [Burkholderia multivorans]HDR9836768.1 hypothetical protein [Burkholderia multivorans]HDR9844762.1 hypothetical protein [Burkholderia multivorans]HDR9851306.1 hypothetical protein [Burkholderia multivorans]